MTEVDHPLLHLVAVGFHHRRGAIVEMVYPSFQEHDPPQSPNDALPAPWKHLASLALPDGAHNYLRDVIYFTLPSLNNCGAVYCIASYRQVDASSLTCLAPEVTRNTVQKSLVVLSRVPLFSLLAHQLSPVTDSLFQDGGFTQETLRQSFELLQQQIKEIVADNALYQDSLFFKLSASNFVRVYARNALVLFKLLLLERRVLFAGESAGWISNWILTLLSLVPGLLSNGLSESYTVDRTWLSKWRSSQQTGADKPAPASIYVPTAFSECQESPSKIHKTNSSVGPKKSKPARKRHNSADQRRLSPCSSPKPSTTYNSVLNELSGQLTERRKFSSPTLELSSQKMISASPFITDPWGFPLALFTQSNILPIYASLGTLDTLLEPLSINANKPLAAPIKDRAVRGFLAGATNPLLQTHPTLSDVIVFTLPPGEALSLAEDTGHASLTSLFEANNRPLGPSRGSAIAESTLTSETRMSTGAIPRPSKRPTTLIHLCQPTPEPDPNPRATPYTLSQALQLSRMDRIFIDHLHRVVTIWYQARTMLSTCCQFSSPDELDEWFCQNEDVDEYLDKLPPIQRTALLRFPSAYIFDTYIRLQFSNYLRSLLLTSQTTDEGIRDFNAPYVHCLRATHAFQVWMRDFDLDRTLLLINPRPCDAHASLKEDETQDAPAKSPASLLDDAPVAPLSSEAASNLFGQHPGRHSAESDDWEQFLDGMKKFRDLAADRGRRLFSQGALSLNKLSTDINATIRSGASSAMFSKFSSVFKSFITSQTSPTAPTNH